MIQVVPVPQNLPEQRHIQLWMAVDASDLSQVGVFWQVYEPAPLTGLCADGSTPVLDTTTDVPMCWKVQVHGTMVPAAACDPDSASSLGDSPAVGKMWEAAVHTGQVMAQAVDDPNYGMNALCSENVKGIFYSSFDLSKEQSCGEYRVDATAVSTGGGTSPTLSNYIDVECVTYLKIDFSSVNWGTITPNVKGQVTGNLLWEPANSIHPTVMNVGNDGMGIGVIFSPMVGATQHKIINNFDACFGKVADATLECIGNTPPYIPANTLTLFGAAAIAPYTGLNPAYPVNQVLCADQSGKLDLSVHPVSTVQLPLPNDTYTGTLTVIGRHVGGICRRIPTNQEPTGH